jgi:hypothetical protein
MIHPKLLRLAERTASDDIPGSAFAIFRNLIAFFS